MGNCLRGSDWSQYCARALSALSTRNRHPLLLATARRRGSLWDGTEWCTLAAHGQHHLDPRENAGGEGRVSLLGRPVIDPLPATFSTVGPNEARLLPGNRQHAATCWSRTRVSWGVPGSQERNSCFLPGRAFHSALPSSACSRC